MRIAITLQSLRHQGGIGIYTREIVKSLLAIDRENEYVLVYPSFGQSHKSLGQFKHYTNVTEILSKSLVPHGNYWDHFVVPRVAKKYGIDVVYNPYQSVPLTGSFRKVLVLQNSEWFTMPEVFWLSERLTGGLRMKAMMRAADRIISISNAVKHDCIQASGLPASKFRTIYYGIGEEFKPVTDEARLKTIMEKYRLPDKFVMFVGGIYPQKNFGGVVRAFSLMASEVPHQLVVAGHPRWKCRDDLELIKQKNLENRVQFLGWVDYADLPVLYGLTDCFVYPSFYEGFGLCLLEAMASGCPVVAASTGALPEVAQGAAVLVDPNSDIEIKEAMLKLMFDGEARRSFIHKGLARAKEFSWEKCAGETLSLISELN